uniref:Glycosyltransferases involved in cell wall biogenesis n=1 Tax=uncultured verrucomicrobium HF0500_08N17 TaxID=723597 RepID=E7C4Y7_9BACT|nr:glycosyltransferases involved in cell wall biogenesis [uncultured verrucomicrobium HF0500_08N17]
MNHYILVTAVKNEEKFLPQLIECVKNQSIRPIIWVIVNDGSTDTTQSIINKQKTLYNWIYDLTLEKGKRDIYARYTYVCKQGFDYSINLCQKKKLIFQYVCLLDADISLERDYYKNIFQEFKLDKKLGIACGNRLDLTNGSFKRINKREDEPYGAASVFRRQCFEEIGGYILADASDNVANAKAKMRGWNCKVFKSIHAKQLRTTNIINQTAYGVWEEFKRHGEQDYYVNYSLYYVIIKAFRHSFAKFVGYPDNPPRPLYSGIAYLLGYLSCIFRRKKKIDDEETKKYYNKIHPRMVMRYYYIKLKKLFND